MVQPDSESNYTGKYGGDGYVGIADNGPARKDGNNIEEFRWQE